MAESMPGTTTYADFRKLFDKEKSLDAVVVSTPTTRMRFP